MANSTARSLVQQHLRLSSYLKLRIVIPLVIYFPLSLSYALVNLAFNLPFGARSVGHGTIFPTHPYWILIAFPDITMPRVSVCFGFMSISLWLVLGSPLNR
jgi:hypothetical protein